ncbi:MAG: dephospho-CoA kinase [Planctomycetota bacterium]
MSDNKTTSSASDVKKPRPGPPVLGLLGAPGSGKSHVARLWQDMGAAVIDADEIARKVLDEPEVRGTLAKWWGAGVLSADGEVDRAAVGARVFDDPGELARLESLVHPRVNARRAELRRLYQADPAVTAIVEDCPLLLERELDGDCDVLVFVDTPRETRVARVAQARGWSAQDLDRREKNQLPLDIKRARADYILNNDADPSAVQTQARQLLDRVSSKKS